MFSFLKGFASGLLSDVKLNSNHEIIDVDQNLILETIQKPTVTKITKKKLL
jgi:hypothetical protein